MYLCVLVHAVIAMGNLLVDFPALSGDAGLIPHSEFLRSVWSEFDFFEIIKFFPSFLFWIDPIVLLWSGLAVAVSGICLPSMQRLACVGSYFTLLSFSQCQGIVLWFPWDCLLLELLLITALVPEARWTYKLILFRVMFGFGKHKFFGADSLEDLTYTASMSCWQPLGTNIGWYLTWLPDAVHVGAIVFTFFAEMIAPFLLWTRFRKPACMSIIALMGMIQVTGHFGWFNSLTGGLAWIVLGDTVRPQNGATPAATSFPNSIRKTISLCYIVMSVVFLIPSQWNSPSLFYQHTFASEKFDVLRIASAWRVVHTYGVFPPKKMPMIKPVGRFLVVDGEGNEQPLEYNYQGSRNTTKTGFAPFSVAPLRFPRFDYIYGFYSASHVFSLATRLGPSFGSGEEFIDSVARHVLDRDRDFSVTQRLFSPNTVPEMVQEVKFFVVGLIPAATGGWEEESATLDKVWRIDTSATAYSVTDSLPPNMIALRMRSRKFQRVRALLQDSGNVTQALGGIADVQQVWDAAVVMSEQPGFVLERVWFDTVRSTFSHLIALSGRDRVDVLSANCGSPRPSALWNTCHAMQFGGYIGCLTSAHLLPWQIHSPLCPPIMVANFEARMSGTPGSAFDKVPIPDFVYWILGILDDVNTVELSHS